ncbi:hypothetical protein J2752_002327 [Halarchaeum rubridurum]|uniref:TIGR04206 family protein n=1 Tax=Halarchaeum rubridurum TaxID=489911 RepID=A0A830G370_9EURY|nr:hypothetical protein [Halarchaeum rubridurum]MBP1955404.1 hypothetical protein [Halarchaeum rubridurum]GGM72141.1 hypothetical protein GCM10009017_22580 [Halarchaeum rubridurum]
MPRWTAPEYENPLAVVFVWVSTLLPWEVAYAALPGPGVSVLFVRWPFFHLRRVADLTGPASELSVALSLGAYQYQAGTTIRTGYLVWTVVSLASLCLLAFSVYFYYREDAVLARLDRPARLVGVALCVTGLSYLGAGYAIYTTGFGGLHVPVGALFQLLFGALLLTNDPA